MTFATKLRLTLILVAIIPTAIITLIVVIGIGGQVKRIENREARDAGARFEQLLTSTQERIRSNIDYIAASRAFQLAELNVQSGRRPDAGYSLPPLSLDFIEYADRNGAILLSAGRPALVGRRLFDSLPGPGPIDYRLTYENDLRGSHPALAVIAPTEDGFLYGGIYLDGGFKSLAEAVTRSQLDFLGLTNESDRALSTRYPPGVPYRVDEQLYAIFAADDEAAFFIRGRFSAGDQDALFTNFLTGVGAATAVSLLIVIVASLYFSSRTRREITDLTDGALRVASGDFTHPVAGGIEGEFSDLADSFNLMMRQLTEYRERLIMSEKIAAWQTIGRKVAHEVKNPLTPISIAADDLRRSFAEGQPQFETILDDCTITIKKEVDRLKKLIDRFASFASMPPPEPAPIAVAGLLDEVRVLYADDVTSGRLRFINEAVEAKALVDAEQIRQVLINLIKNSLETGCDLCTVRVVSADETVRIVLEDDGPGFPEKILEGGVTPYFSTKERGSGLGLVICQRIIFDHEGAMTLGNRDEGGARVDIALPQLS